MSTTPPIGATRRFARPAALAPSERTLTVALVLLGLSQMGLAAFQAVAPHAFYRTFGGFGPRNDHYVRDVATFTFAIGAALLASARYRSWRVPVLALTTLQFALHSVNHLADIDRARYAGQGPGDFVALAVTALVLGGLLRASARPPGPPGRREREGEREGVSR